MLFAKRKQYYGLLFSLYLCLFSIHSFALEPPPPTEAVFQITEPVFEHGLLWKISPPQNAESPAPAASYLFGTIHVSDPDIIALPEVITQRFTQADSLSLELILNLETQLRAAQSLLLPPGKSLAVLLGKDDFQRLAQVLMQQHGMLLSSVMDLKPWAAMVLLMYPKEDGDVLDFVLQEKAEKSGKTLYALETVESQLATLDSFSLDEQVFMLRETLNDLAQVTEMIKQLKVMYKARNIGEMWRYNAAEIAKGSPKEQALMKRFMYLLLDKRNQNMVDAMLPRLKEGNAFVAVGALHLPGEQGLLNLLQQQGYQLEALY